MKVGINGFGRIGKHIYKILAGKGIEVPLVNDLLVKPSQMYYLLKYDSTFGRTEGVELKEDVIHYKNSKTSISSFDDPSKIPWDKYGVDYVIEASGVFLTVEACERHKNVKNVIITAPSTDAPTLVYGVNHREYQGQKVVSNASCTTNCLAPLAKIVNDEFGIREGLMTTIHALTSTQKVLDGTSKNLRNGRGAMQNIIPHSTGAAVAVGKVLPELNGKLNGMAMRVPVANVSVVDLVCKTVKKTTIDEIARKIEAKAKDVHNVIGVTRDDVVSSDFNGDCRSSIFDVNASMAMGEDFFKLVAWYDNEYGYSARVVDLLLYLHSVQKAQK